MIFFVDNDGTIIKNLPSPVYQGAANTNTIYLIAPFASGLTASVAFQLPNGIVVPAEPMTQQNSLQGIINKETGEEYSGWTYAIPSEITEYYGTVTAQFYFYTEVDGMITATSATSFQVAKGVPAVLPDEPSADVYEQILSVIASLQKQLNNGAFAARAIYAWNSAYTYGANEITFYPVGEFGAFVKSIRTNNKEEPYIDGKLNSEYWEEVVSFDEISEAYFQKLKDLADAAADSAEEAAKSAEEAAKSASDLASLANRIIKFVPELPEVGEPDYIYAIVSNQDSNLFDLWAWIDGVKTYLGSANLITDVDKLYFRTLPADGWANNKQIVKIQDLTAEQDVSIYPMDVSAADYINCGISARIVTDPETAIEFSCTTVPSASLGIFIQVTFRNELPTLSGYYTKVEIDRETGHSLELTIDPSTYIVTLKLISKDGTVLSTGSIDLPLESVVVGGSYDAETKSIVLTLNNGQTISIPVADLIDGLASQTALDAEITARQQADTALQTKINDETAAREQADGALSGRIDELSSNTVKITAQTLTAEQQQQARENIDAVGTTDLGVIQPKSDPLSPPTETSPYVIFNDTDKSAYVRKVYQTAENTIYPPEAGCLYYAIIKGDYGVDFRNKFKIVWMTDDKLTANAGGTVSINSHYYAEIRNIEYCSVGMYDTIDDAEYAIKNNSTEYTAVTYLRYYDDTRSGSTSNPVVKSNVTTEFRYPYNLYKESSGNGVTADYSTANINNPFDGNIDGMYTNVYVKLLDENDTSGTYPEMTVGNATNAKNDGLGNQIDTYYQPKLRMGEGISISSDNTISAEKQVYFVGINLSEEQTEQLANGESVRIDLTSEQGAAAISEKTDCMFRIGLFGSEEKLEIPRVVLNVNDSMGNSTAVFLDEIGKYGNETETYARISIVVGTSSSSENYTCFVSIKPVNIAETNGTYPEMTVGNATNANKALSADTAANADNAIHATNADNANNATNADNATTANKVANKLSFGSKTYDGSAAQTIAKSDIGLGNVDNTSDANKPVSTAQQAALDLKQNINDNSLTTTAKTVTGAINENKTAIDGIREQITNEAHFRGYFASEADLKAEYPTATPNDYAYVADAGQKSYIWIWGSPTANQWNKSDDLVPDQLTPKSTTVPLMNGTAAIGNTNTYADGAHVHPVDTSRASQTALNSEITNRTNADTALGNRIDKEITDRTAEDELLGTRIENHIADKSNPHGVTAAQAGALSINGGTLSGFLTVSGAITGNNDVNVNGGKIRFNKPQTTGGWARGVELFASSAESAVREGAFGYYGAGSDAASLVMMGLSKAGNNSWWSEAACDGGVFIRRNAVNAIPVLQENGTRVYSANNKPSPADIGAATAAQATSLQTEINNIKNGTTVVSKATSATTADKVANALKLTIDGVEKTYTGAAEVAVTINTSSSNDPNAVHFTAQTLTAAQQKQARTNIGAASSSDTAISIATTKWSSNAVTLTASDYVAIGNVTASSHVELFSSDASAAAFITNNIRLTAQAAGSITISCASTPTAAITANLLILN